MISRLNLPHFDRILLLNARRKRVTIRNETTRIHQFPLVRDNRSQCLRIEGDAPRYQVGSLKRGFNFVRGY